MKKREKIQRKVKTIDEKKMIKTRKKTDKRIIFENRKEYIQKNKVYRTKPLTEVMRKKG